MHRQTYQSIHIAAPIDQVWERVRNFHDFSWASQVIERCDAVGDQDGTTVGARRVLNGVFHETLTEHDPRNHRLRYSIDEGPSPVSSSEVTGYFGTLHLLPVTEGGGTFVQWYSDWASDSDAGIEFCHTIYVALLQALRDTCEAR